MKKKYSLLIGRYSPWHKGHRALAQALLNEGKNVCIAIRDTEESTNDPYTAEERFCMIHEDLKEQVRKGRVKIIIIPDIEEICYGRKVGWGIREIRLDEEIEAISATKIRGGI